MKGLAAAAGVALVAAIAAGAWWRVASPAHGGAPGRSVVDLVEGASGAHELRLARASGGGAARAAGAALPDADRGAVQRMDVATPRARFHGEVLAQRGLHELDRPVPDVRVAIGVEGGAPRETRTDEEGTFSFEFDHAVVVESIAVGAGARTGGRRLTGPWPVEPGRSFRLDLWVAPSEWGGAARAPALRHLDLEARDPAGVPIAGLEVTLRQLDGRAIRPRVRHGGCRTDARGRLHLHGLPAARVALAVARAREPGGYAPEPPSHRFEVDLRSQPLEPLRIVVPPDPPPTERALVLRFRRAAEGPHEPLVGLGTRGEDIARAPPGRVDLDRIWPVGRPLRLQLERGARSEAARVEWVDGLGRLIDGELPHGNLATLSWRGWRLDDGSARGFGEPIVWRVAPEAGVLRVELPGHAPQRVEVPAGLDDVHAVFFFPER